MSTGPRVPECVATSSGSEMTSPRGGHDMIESMGVRAIIFSVNCYIAAVLALFISFSLDLKVRPGLWSLSI